LSAGELYWIIDDYTRSRYCPYSEAFFRRRSPARALGAQAFTAADQAGYLSRANYVRNAVKGVLEPYHVMWEPPDVDDVEFIQMMPFTPQNPQVLIGCIGRWSVGRRSCRD
jgi:uncharacterized membrane protein (UPF0182 family)